MEKDEVLINLENFTKNQQLEGARGVFKEIEQTISKDSKSESACVLIHVDQEMSNRISTFLSGSPKAATQAINHTLCIAISQGAKPGRESREYLLNAAKLLIRVDADKLGLDSKKSRHWKVLLQQLLPFRSHVKEEIWKIVFLLKPHQKK